MAGPTRIEISRAGTADLDTVLGILDEATIGLLEHGIPTVWKPGGFSRQTFLEQIQRGEAYLALVDKAAVGTFILQWSDVQFWGEHPPDAGYVHKLAIKPAYSGRGIGVEMLKWAETAARNSGKKFLRLNCLAADRKTRDYYEKAGFIHVDDVAEPRGTASLYEKPI